MSVRGSERGAVDVDAFIDERAVSAFQWLVVALCCTACFCAGFNLLASGYLAPSISRDLHLARGVIGALFVSVGCGTTFGSLALGPLADRFGRKPIVVGALLAAAPVLSIAALGTRLEALMAGEFLGTFALMGIIPIAMAGAGEYVPRRLKTTLVVVVFSGLPVGTISAGIVSALVLPRWGWHSVFAVDAVLPLVVAPLIALILPESVDVLARRPANRARIAAVLRRIDPAARFDPGTTFVTAERAEQGFPVALLFHEGRTALTVCLWVMFFANFLSLFSTSMWLPTILHDANVEERAAIGMAALISLGGIFGGIGISELCDRLPRRRFAILAVAYLLGGVMIAAVGWAGPSLVAVGAAVLLAGFFNSGVQNAANATSATVYPASMRSTGAAWALGIGQSAQIFGPLASAVLVAHGWHERALLSVIALPTAIAMLAALVLHSRFAGAGSHHSAAAG